MSSSSRSESTLATEAIDRGAALPSHWTKRWRSAALGLTGLTAVLVLAPIWIMGRDSDYSCGSVLFRPGDGREQNCEFIGAYRDRLVLIYVCVGFALLTAAVAARRLGPARKRRAVGAAAVAVPLLILAAWVGWKASDERPPSIEVSPTHLDAPGNHTLVVTGRHFEHWPRVEIVTCSVQSSSRPCRAGAGTEIEPRDDGRLEVTFTIDVPAEGVFFGAFSPAGAIDLSPIVEVGAER